MILVLSGEGPTDLGTRRPNETGRGFVPGPMAWIVDNLLALPGKLNYSILELHANGGDCVCFLSETELSALKYGRPRFFPRESGMFGIQPFRANAHQLGKHALAVARERGAPVVAILFRDSDGTNSAPRTLWKVIFESIKAGFQLAGFQSGVPMVPRPKSEAWMLCGLLKREDAGRDCLWLEEEPGNDASPKSLKLQLAKHLNCEPTADQQAELVRDGTIDPALIDLPSFTAFSAELDRAYALAAQPLN
ncbi:MAG: hypothetical protein P4K93_10415 [Terracidiphilus sp.]|nr:hypothetical protein [Terracidiphilus sp.]MDR3798558.1 hypothetical protein [Terracidiphilus sp.]